MSLTKKATEWMIKNQGLKQCHYCENANLAQQYMINKLEPEIVMNACNIIWDKDSSTCEAAMEDKILCPRFKKMDQEEIEELHYGRITINSHYIRGRRIP